jgi:hypothetical protein
MTDMSGRYRSCFSGNWQVKIIRSAGFCSCYLEDGVQFVIVQPLFLSIFFPQLSEGGDLSGSVHECIEIDCYSGGNYIPY